MHMHYNMTTLFNNHPYLSTSKFNAANWHATATQVHHFKIVTTHCYYYYRLGQALKTARCTFRHKHLFTGNDIAVKMLTH